jgi:hypothetical protein
MLDPWAKMWPACATLSALLPVAFLSGLVSLGRAQTVPVQKFNISVDQPAYTGQPLWLHADVTPTVPEVHYPYRDNPADFGPNLVELAHNGVAVTPRSHQTWPTDGSGIVDGSIAPVGSPPNRLPLHVLYAVDEPGRYSVRWTKLRHEVGNQGMVEVTLARSDWITFEVRRSTLKQRDAWLQTLLANAPTNPGALVGDYLPSLLAAAPDVRALRAVLDQTYSPHEVVGSVASGSLQFFTASDIATEVVGEIKRRGPSDGLAYVVSWKAQLFQDRQEVLAGICIQYVQPAKSTQVAAALKMLGFVLHSQNWPAAPELTSWANGHVLATAPAIIADGNSSATQQLAIYLGGIKTDRSRQLLTLIALRPGTEGEQARTALTWIGDPHDLRRLAESMTEPGDPDKYGRDRSSLPYSLVYAYGDQAIPYLESALVQSPYVFVRTQCAEELAQMGRPAAFQFFLDAVQNNRFYKQEMVRWLEDRFPSELPRSADESRVLAFLRAHLSPK